MCRYSFKTYKSHFACFNCRKTFKQVPYTDLLHRIGKAEQYEKLIRKPVKSLTDEELLQIDEVKKTLRDREIKCPQCGGYMADLGLDFRSPKKTAEKEWKIIEGLFTIGKSFYGCGRTGMGYVP